MNRKARCQCGALTVEVRTDPEHVVMCHCEDCQRRTGSSFHVGAWWPEHAVSPSGKSKRFVRAADSGAETELYFCPECGTNIYFRVPGLLPGMLGVAVGCFTDPDFPPPRISVYGKRRHRWVQVPDGVPAYLEWTDGDRE